MSEDFLQQMAQSSRERVRIAKAQRSQAELLSLAAHTPEPPPLLANEGGFDLIAEVKLRSPAAGVLKTADEDVGARVARYASAGAAAISVLTEPSRFDGSMEHLQSAARALAPLRVPAMRKDFLVDPYQVIEARAAGAGGVLIILRMLPRDVLEALIEQALALKLFALLEAFDEQDIELAHALADKYAARAGAAAVHTPASGEQGAASGNAFAAVRAASIGGSPAARPLRLLVGVNCRDLVTLKVVPGRLEALAALLPANAPRVAESGVGSPDDAARVAHAGYDFALVGSALMTAPDPRVLAGSMLAAARTARSSLPSGPLRAASSAPAIDTAGGTARGG